MTKPDESTFRDFARAQAPGLRRVAYLLCGEWHLAEDLMQDALLKIYRAWSRVRETDRLGNYARRVLLRVWLDEKRKPWRRREHRAAPVPEVADEALDPAASAQRNWVGRIVRQGLAELPPKQRAAVVLRYFEELSVAEAAEVLGCSEGNVKSQTARGLAALGRILAPLDPTTASSRYEVNVP
ncbi:RNA polymerase sigma factor [Amycolatopsis cihanbeyliensis]|uniref:RNA polymerase sigma-70 factor (Sigma-E family) n=1 Tax=Amycolatopsis cihanbeyliensis TaxID=1128664 RepID=A0A542DKG8_AMYCI|nr:SigE family RNA polymerase sigma factor [Amycolatopsis cihanbeyliensis]TQJ03579.1 RNA polymerase sigma-70 factor (sigma-E family) [Amycolatopsis cihanbeyliensis]